jgi:NADH-quinone oxidoreductase subunit N
VRDSRKHSLVDLSIFLFAVHTAIGFFPLATGEIFGGSFTTSPLIHFFKNALNVGVLILLLQSARWIKTELVGQQKGTEFIIILFSSLLGLYYMISAGDFLMFYIGLELSTLPLAALAAIEHLKRISSEAGIKLILSAGFASGISLFGISMLYAATGSIFFADISLSITDNALTVLGFILFVSGLSFKISLVPFHFWTADVYEGAPVSIASYLSVISKGAAVLALATMFVGNLFALRQQNIKRFLAFSSIAQAGFILLGIIPGNQLGLSTVVYFVMIYVFSNLAAFGVVQAISSHSGKENIDDYNGLYRSNPRLSLVMMLALFSLAGIPPVAGFFGKFFLFTAAASAGYYLLVFLAVVNVTISLYYYLLVIRAMFIRKSELPIPHFRSDLYMQLGLALTVIGILAIGLFSPIYQHIFELSGL